LSYNPNIPQANSKRSISQRQIRVNYQAIYSAFANNHATLGTEEQGRHRVLVLRTVADPATTASQVAIYQKLVTAIPNLFYRPSNNQTPIQMTYPSVLTGLQTITPPVYYTDQYSFVAGPFVIYGGKVLNPGNNSPVTLSPNTTLKYVGLIITNYKFTGIGTPAAIAVAIPTSVSGNQFNISFQTQPSGVSFDVYYLAIGQ